MTEATDDTGTAVLTDVRTGVTITDPAPPNGTTPLNGERRVRDLVQNAQRDISLLVSKEVELAKAELQDAVKKGAIGGAGFGVAAVLAFFAVMAGVMCFGFGLAAAGLSLWLAFLVVMLVLLAVAGGAAFAGVLSLKKLKAPTSAIEGAKADIAAARPHHT
ncbi:MAG TPA: phage holin family protein [Mycobacteriales bacterium]|nr:phage holin family protein [Mycobacteriales bacterium]